MTAEQEKIAALERVCGELRACPICGNAPHESKTEAGSTCIRCDGVPAGGAPRHTLFAQDRDAEVARGIWAKVAGVSLAEAVALLAEPVQDADWCWRRDAFLGRVR